MTARRVWNTKAITCTRSHIRVITQLQIRSLMTWTITKSSGHGQKWPAHFTTGLHQLSFRFLLIGSYKNITYCSIQLEHKHSSRINLAFRVRSKHESILLSGLVNHMKANTWEGCGVGCFFSFIVFISGWFLLSGEFLFQDSCNI